MIRARGVTYRYPGTTSDVLAGVDLDVAEEGLLGIVGPNGSGKSTLLALLQGLRTPRAGSVHLDGRDLRHTPAHLRARRIASVAQAERSDPALTVRELVALGRLPHRGLLAPAGARDAAVTRGALARAGLTHVAERPLGTLSGGERRRADIARALAQEARHLLLDEPTNHLDAGHVHALLGWVRTLPGAVVVLHDLDLARQYCDTVLVLDRGRVVARGPAPTTLVPTVLDPVYRVRHRLLSAPGGGTHLVVRPGPGHARASEGATRHGPVVEDWTGDSHP